MEAASEEEKKSFDHRIVQIEDGSIFKSKFEICEELGRGRFGTVFKVKNSNNGEIFAAKFIKCRKLDDKRKCKDEISIMNMLDSPMLIQLAAAYENPREIIMVLEYTEGGELFEKVCEEEFTLTEYDCEIFIRQICQAMEFMHKRSIVHLDLKPENILIRSKNSHLIKIADFGLAKELKEGEPTRIMFGTAEFVSPEVINYDPVSTASDMWSVGVICYVLLSGLSPFMGDTDLETFGHISSVAYDFDNEAFDEISEESKDFISKLLVKSQCNRLTASECTMHPWLNPNGDHESQNETVIKTDKLKVFLARWRWKKIKLTIQATSLKSLKRTIEGNEKIWQASCDIDSTCPIELPKQDEDDLGEIPFEHRIVQIEDGSNFKSKYEVSDELGRCQFGVVYKVKDKSDGKILAAKFVKCRTQEDKKKCKNEISIMNDLDSPKLLQLAAAYENPREIIMVMECIDGGELFEKVIDEEFDLTEYDCQKFMHQICQAMVFMHEKSIVHLDLKPENILLKSKTSYSIKIADFGLAKKLKPDVETRIMFGTVEFVSPEVVTYDPVSTTSDMWSVGVICYVLLSGLSPFMGDTDLETFNNISSVAYDFEDESFDDISEDAKDFISKSLIKSQTKRLTATKSLLHPWLTRSYENACTIQNHVINTEKLRRFLARWRWRKAKRSIGALEGFSSMGMKKNSDSTKPDSPILRKTSSSTHSM